MTYRDIAATPATAAPPPALAASCRRRRPRSARLSQSQIRFRFSLATLLQGTGPLGRTVRAGGGANVDLPPRTARTMEIDYENRERYQRIVRPLRDRANERQHRIEVLSTGTEDQRQDKIVRMLRRMFQGIRRSAAKRIGRNEVRPTGPQGLEMRPLRCHPERDPRTGILSATGPWRVRPSRRHVRGRKGALALVIA